MKIIFSATKELNTENLIKKANDLNFIEVNEIIEYLKNLDELTTFKILKTKNNLYLQNQQINQYSKPAIELYNGISFRQLTNKSNRNYQNLMILSALYGFSYAFDYISPYRYDYTMKNANKYRKAIYQKINYLLKNEDIVYDLASKEYSNGIEHPNLISFVFYILDNKQLKQNSVTSKKMRGQMVNYLINNSSNLKAFTYDGFKYNHELSSANKFVYVKEK
ncbi:YaaA family protein [Erysipelotrichaceae bacterium OttesenSCG-928-M19]|nr:YaaA family protein [Erysipelotrichaceae bacterium OttesenSCG-928-M19]